MQMGGARQKHNAEGGREAKKFKNHCPDAMLNKPLYLQNGARYRKMLHNIKVASFDL